MAGSVARRIEEDASRSRRHGASLRAVDGAKRSSGSKPKSGRAAKPTSVRTEKPVPKAAPARGGGARKNAPKQAGAAKPRGKAVPQRGVARTRPRPAAYAADGLIQRATAAVLPSRCVENPLTMTCRSAFRVFMVVLIAVSAFGMVRVTLSAQAAETLVASEKVKVELRAERLALDDLEISRVSLAEPSRIESIAATSMRMTRPISVRYIALPARLSPGSKAPGPAKAETGAGSMLPGGIQGIVGAAAQITAREAQVLLASGSGLGGAR